jgi:hypothetical protein
MRNSAKKPQDMNKKRHYNEAINLNKIDYISDV